MDDLSPAANCGSSREREERLNTLMRADEMQTILAVQQAITSRLDPGAVLQMIADEARRLTSAEMSAVYLRKEDQLEIVVLSGTVEKEMVGWKIPVNSSVAGRAVMSKEGFLIADAQQENIVHSGLVRKVGAKSFVVAPLISGETALGTITVANRSPNSLSEHDRQLLMMLAPGAVIALENARLYEQAQQVAALEERQRLARELHDAVTQTLFSASLIADVLPRIWQRNPEEGMLRLDELRRLTRGALAEMRSLLMELRPTALLELDFEELLQQLCDAFTARTQIPVSFSHSGTCALPGDVQVALYRAVQETLAAKGQLDPYKQVGVTLACAVGGVEIVIGGGSTCSLPGSGAGDGTLEKKLQSQPHNGGIQVETASDLEFGLKTTIRWRK